MNYNLNKKYSTNFNKYGMTPNGVFWNSNHNQTKKFEELLNKITDNKAIIADVGCGYGALYRYIYVRNLLTRFTYQGVDINLNFINCCKKKYPNVDFFLSNKPFTNVDYALMSGTYNLAVINNIAIWEKYILDNLRECFLLCKSGIIFNMQISNLTEIRNNIFYTTERRMVSLLFKITKNIKCFKSNYFSNEIIFVLLR